MLELRGLELLGQMVVILVVGPLLVIAAVGLLLVLTAFVPRVTWRSPADSTRGK